jgi:hypothetical protein
MFLLFSIQIQIHGPRRSPVHEIGFVKNLQKSPIISHIFANSVILKPNLNPWAGLLGAGVSQGSRFLQKQADMFTFYVEIMNNKGAFMTVSFRPPCFTKLHRMCSFSI